MKILLVEDDSALRGYIAAGLTRLSYVVDQAASVVEAQRIASEHRYDIILTDMALQGPSDGNVLIKSLRQAKNMALIIVITGESNGDVEMAAYEAGADDYIIKPFTLDKLGLKLRAWQSRRQEFLDTQISSTFLKVGDVRLDVLRRRAIRKERIISLTNIEFGILEYFIRNKGKIVTPNAILQAVWKYDYDPETNVVGVAINRLRKKLDQGETKSVITTVIGSGYIVDDETLP